MKAIRWNYLLALAPLPGLACEPALQGDDIQKAEGRHYVVAWRVDPAPLRPREFFALDVATCANARDNAPRELRFDAVMPEHNHGMNYRPTVTALGDGRFRVEGLLLHMPGHWQLRFEIRGSGKTEVISESVSLR